MRRALVAGNWKMNPPGRDEAVRLAAAIAGHVADGEPQAVICPPAIWLMAVAEAIVGSDVAVGAQNMHAEERGAYTGEISPLMLRGLATYCILGHSERRRDQHETDEVVAAKVAAAVRHRIRPIAAIGERDEERRAGETAAVIDRQLRAAVSRLDRLEGSGLVIAYEPVWAIGTGNAASPDDAQDAAAQIRATLREIGGEAADAVPILYGGSVSAANAGQFFREPDVDGALVGGASLDAGEFLGIVAAAGAARPA